MHVSGKNYVASINEKKEWEWEPAHCTPCYVKIGENWGPLFKDGDTLRLRKHGCKGPHDINLARTADTPAPFSYISKQDPHPPGVIFPFDAPYHALDFPYNPDSETPSMQLLRIRHDGAETVHTNWQLTIIQDGKGIDPEFQVGPGGVPTTD